MLVTAANVGDIIHMNHRARCVLIEEVNDQHILYRQESGTRYASYDREIDGSVVKDKRRISEFHTNCQLGAALVNAQMSAYYKLLSYPANSIHAEEANMVLSISEDMRKALLDRIADIPSVQKPEAHASLSDMISRASLSVQKGSSTGNKKIAADKNASER